jgi:four helix bundle protein
MTKEQTAEGSKGPAKGGQLAERTLQFALSVIDLQSRLPRTMVANVIGRQFLRSGTSVGAQYREACRARTPAEFISKLESAMQELEESRYWLELLEKSKIAAAATLAPLVSDATEISKMMVASIRTVKAKQMSRSTRSAIQHSSLSIEH